MSYTYNDLRREAFYNELAELEIDYDFIKVHYDAEEKERIEIDYTVALVNCYCIFRILRDYSDIITRFYFKNDNFYIFLK